MTDIYNNEHINNTSNNLNEESDIPLIKNIKQNPKAFSSKKPSIFKNKYNNSNNNINNKNLNTSINDDIIIQIRKENKKEINDIKNLYEKKIREISLFYENKFIDLNKLLKNNLNEYKLLCSNYISLADHKNIINDFKKNYNELLNKTKENYEKLINELTDIMKNKQKYQDLIQRLQLYTKYEIEINDIEKILVNNLNEKINEQNKNNNTYLNDFYLLSQLDEDINYHRKICELKQIYEEKMLEFKTNNNDQFNNLINQVKSIYDNYSNFSSNKYLNNNKQIVNEIKELNKEILFNDKVKKNIKNEINDISVYKENECKSISNSDKNSEYINQYSSKEIDNLINLENSNEQHQKPEKMEINCKPSSFK